MPKKNVTSDEQKVVNTVTALQAANVLAREIFGNQADAKTTFGVYDLFELDEDGAVDDDEINEVKENMNTVKKFSPTIFPDQEVSPETYIELYLTLFPSDE